jgi:hypothetical protein
LVAGRRRPSIYARKRRDCRNRGEGQVSRQDKNKKGEGQRDEHHLNNLGGLPRLLVVLPAEFLAKSKQGSLGLGSDELELASLGVLVFESGRVEDQSVVEEVLNGGRKVFVQVRHLEREILSADSSLDLAILVNGLQKKRIKKRV